MLEPSTLQGTLRPLTYADYLTWPEGRRDELIDGIAYLKEPPAPSPIHQALVGELYYQIRTALEGRTGRVFIAPLDVRLPKSDEADEQIDTVVQPDLLIISDCHRLDEHGLRGAPEWVAEVLSPTTARHDQIVKLPTYERARVPEVWLIHPTDRTLSIYRLAGGRYARATILELKGKTAIGALPEISIDWDRVAERLS